MPTTLIFQWVLWGASLLAAAVAIGTIFKLRLAEQTLPAWSKIKEINAQLPVLREEQRQVRDAVASQRALLATLESEVLPLRQLREWQDANPDAPLRLQHLLTDLEQASAKLAEVQQNLNRLREERDKLTEQVFVLRKQVGTLEKQKGEVVKNAAKEASPTAKRKRKTS